MGRRRSVVSENSALGNMSREQEESGVEEESRCGHLGFFGERLSVSEAVSEKFVLYTSNLILTLMIL